MAKKNQEQEVLSIQLKDKEGDVLASEGTETEFDDISPRFTRVVTERAREENDEDEIDRLARDEDEDEEDEDERDEQEERDEEDEEQEDEDEDADEPSARRRGRNDSVSRRVARAQRLTDEARGEARELRGRLDALEDQLKAQADERDFADFRTKTEAKLADLRAQKKVAIEEGNTDKQVDLEEEIADLRADLKVREREQERAKAQLKEAADRRKSSPIVATRANQWMRKHPRFNTDPEFQAAVRGLDQAVKAAGFDPETDEYFEELDRRVKKQYPDEYPKVRDKTRRRGPSEHRGSARGSEPGARRTERAGKFTIKDGKLRVPAAELKRIQANMVRYGMNPSDPEDVKAYVMNNRS